MVTYVLLLSMKISIVEYVQEDGTNPYKDWFNDLDSASAAKVYTAILRLEMGNTSNVKWFDGMGEYRINWGPGYRIYLLKEGDSLIILFGGGTKKTQQNDIKSAKKLLAEYKGRKAKTKRTKQ